MAQNNVVVLTSGLSGSSVVTALIARAGYWTGESTAFKQTAYDSYDTYENRELVALNERLFVELAFDGELVQRFEPAWEALFDSGYERVNRAPYEAFLKQCHAHGPWIWKDPRLSLALRFWIRLLPVADVRFVVLGRNSHQLWTSMLLKRQIVSLAYLRRYEANIRNSVETLLQAYGAQFCALSYDALIEQPEPAIAHLNGFLQTALTVDDLAAVYQGALGRPTRGLGDTVKARLIYFKNFSQRKR